MSQFINNTIQCNFKIFLVSVFYPSFEKIQYAVGFSVCYYFFSPRDTNTFNVKINVAPLSHVTFVLTYDELLQRRRGQYEHIIYIDPKQVTLSFTIIYYFPIEAWPLNLPFLKLSPQNTVIFQFFSILLNQYLKVYRKQISYMIFQEMYLSEGWRPMTSIMVNTLYNNLNYTNYILL